MRSARPFERRRARSTRGRRHRRDAALGARDGVSNARSAWIAPEIVHGATGCEGDRQSTHGVGTGAEIRDHLLLQLIRAFDRDAVRTERVIARRVTGVRRRRRTASQRGSPLLRCTGTRSRRRCQLAPMDGEQAAVAANGYERSTERMILRRDQQPRERRVFGCERVSEAVEALGTPLANPVAPVRFDVTAIDHALCRRTAERRRRGDAGVGAGIDTAAWVNAKLIARAHAVAAWKLTGCASVGEARGRRVRARLDPAVERARERRASARGGRVAVSALGLHVAARSGSLVRCGALSCVEGRVADGVGGGVGVIDRR